MNRVALTLMGLLLPAALVAQQPLLGNEACTAFVQQGLELVRQNKFNEGLALFEKAEKTDPKASGPFSGRAVAFYLASTVAPKGKVEEYRKRAADLASAALARNPRDPLALEISRYRQEGESSPEHTANPEAATLIEEGENLFGAHKYDQAKAKYLAAFEKDPKHGVALVFAGDCDFRQKDFAQAAVLFRKGVQVDPFYVKGWRYLGRDAWPSHVRSPSLSVGLVEGTGQAGRSPGYQPGDRSALLQFQVVKRRPTSAASPAPSSTG